MVENNKYMFVMSLRPMMTPNLHIVFLQVVSDLPFIHPTEVALLNRLCRLATHYSRFTTFIKLNCHSPQKGLQVIYLKLFLTFVYYVPNEDSITAACNVVLYSV